jgi:protein-tyrosine phosphatase
MSDHVQMQFNQITDQIFLGTNSCCQVHFEESLLAKGITADVSMEGERIDAAFGVETYLWLPTADHEAPSQKKLWLGSDYLYDVVNSGDKAYVHCMNGHGRGPTMVAAFLIKHEQMGVQESIDYIAERRPEIHIEDVQVAALGMFEVICKKHREDHN